MELRLETCADTVSGSLTCDGRERTFAGWLQLLELLMELGHEQTGASRGAGPAAARTAAGR